MTPEIMEKHKALNMTRSHQRLHRKRQIAKGQKKRKGAGYKSTGLVADISRPWLRGFLGEPL